MPEMNAAMAAKDYDAAEKVCENWIADIRTARAEVEKIGDYKGDTIILGGAREFLDDFEKFVQEDYKKLIDLRRAGQPDQVQLRKNNEKMALFASNVNAIIDTFVGSYDPDGNRIDTTFVNPVLEQANNLETEENPLFEAVHGVTLEDYAEIAFFLANGGKNEEICEILGIEMPVFDEINAIWAERMRTDSSFMVAMKYSQFFANAGKNPKFQKKNISTSENSSANFSENFSEKIRNDETFYYELWGARDAAYALWVDGALWIEKNYGISFADFQSAAMEWMQKSSDINRMLALKERKQQEYILKISEEKNISHIADDIEF